MCLSSIRASSRSLAVLMALPRSGSRKYSLRLIPVLLSETRLSGCSYAAALPKSSRLCSDAVKLHPKLARQSLAGVSTCQRKVRAPQSRVLGNAQAPRGDEQGHRDEPVPSGVKRGDQKSTRLNFSHVKIS